MHVSMEKRDLLTSFFEFDTGFVGLLVWPDTVDDETIRAELQPAVSVDCLR
jgi:hypothetical protein